MAEELPGGRRAGAPAGVLARAVGRPAAGAGTADRSATPSGAESPGGERELHDRRGGSERARAAVPGAGDDAVYDAAGGLQDAAPPLQRANRDRSGEPDRRPDAGRDRTAHRFLRQHPCAADGPVGEPELRGTARGGQGDGAGSLRAPGDALRAAGGGTAAGAEPELCGRLSSLLRIAAAAYSSRGSAHSEPG